MDPFSIAAILGFIGSKLGEHYVPKILDAADRAIMDSFGRDGQSSPDQEQIGKYLAAHPETAMKVQAEIEKANVGGVVLPDGQLVPADRLIVFAGVLNAILSVVRAQKRDLALTGFFNSTSVTSLFAADGASQSTFHVTNKHIVCDVVPPVKIFLVTADSSQSAEDINATIRSVAASAAEHTGIKAIKSLRDLVKKERQVLSIYPDFVELPTGKDAFGMSGRLRSLFDVDALSPADAAFLKIGNPYKAVEQMLTSLRKESDAFYLSAPEQQELRRLASLLTESATKR